MKVTEEQEEAIAVLIEIVDSKSFQDKVRKNVHAEYIKRKQEEQDASSFYIMQTNL